MLIFVRHGSTLCNIDGKIQGKTNSNLEELGKKQIYQLKTVLQSRYDIKVAFSSDLFRARETSSILRDRKLVTYDSRLSERNFGIYEALNRKELLALRNERQLLGVDPTQQWNWDLEVEQDAEVFARFLSMSREHDIINYAKEHDVLIVTHANFIKCFFYQILGISSFTPSAFKINEGSYMSFNVRPPLEFELVELWQNPIKRKVI